VGSFKANSEASFFVVVAAASFWRSSVMFYSAAIPLCRLPLLQRFIVVNLAKRRNFQLQDFFLRTYVPASIHFGLPKLCSHGVASYTVWSKNTIFGIYSEKFRSNPILPRTGIWTHFPMGKLRQTLQKCLLNFFCENSFSRQKTRFSLESDRVSQHPIAKIGVLPKIGFFGL
jgi:hypothetical protein